MKLYVLTFLLLFFVFKISLYTNENIIPIKDDTIIIKPFISNPKYSFEISYYKNNSSDKKKIKYQPNTGISPGISISYKFFGLTLSKSTDILKENDGEKYSDSDYIDFSVYKYQRKFGFDFFYSKYKGFYSSNENNLIRNDINVINSGFNSFYSFSDNFSFKASFHNLEKQNKRDWSFLIMFSYLYTEINSDYNLSSINRTFKNAKINNITLLPGFGITLPYKNVYLTYAFFAGTGYTHKQTSTVINTNIKKINSNGLNIKYNMKLSIGYNNKKYFFGYLYLLDHIYSATYMEFPDNEEYKNYYRSISSSISYHEIYFGYYF